MAHQNGTRQRIHTSLQCPIQPGMPQVVEAEFFAVLFRDTVSLFSLVGELLFALAAALIFVVDGRYRDKAL